MDDSDKGQATYLEGNLLSSAYLDLSARNLVVRGSSNNMLISRLQGCRRGGLNLDYLPSQRDLVVTHAHADVVARVIYFRETGPWKCLLLL